MTFGNYVGNQRLVQVLQQMLQTGRVPPALLFSGQQGVGKFTLATLFARAANCEAETAELCGRCPPCKSLESLEALDSLRQSAVDSRGSADPESVPLILRPHPNVSVLVPDGAFIRVSQMRYVVREVYREPVGKGQLLFLIDQAERLRFDYADVLLKVLEEPAPRTTLILVTSEPFKLRPTIRSRCVTLHFSPLSRKEIEAQLKPHRPTWSRADCELAAAASGGSLATALTLNLDEYRRLRQAGLELLRSASDPDHNQPHRLFAATAALAGKATGSEEAPQGDRAQKFDFALQILYSLANDLVYLGSRAEKRLLQNPDISEELQKLGAKVSQEGLRNLVRGLDLAHSWQRRNVNRQLTLDAIAAATPVEVFK